MGNARHVVGWCPFIFITLMQIFVLCFPNSILPKVACLLCGPDKDRQITPASREIWASDSPGETDSDFQLQKYVPTSRSVLWQLQQYCWKWFITVVQWLRLQTFPPWVLSLLSMMLPSQQSSHASLSDFVRAETSGTCCILVATCNLPIQRESFWASSHMHR